MKAEQFFYIVEIADTGSFSQAARNLFISQPNLSHAVKQIEKEVGFPLFVRTATGVVPTQQGRRLIDQFRVIKRDFDQIPAIVQSASRTPQLSLRIATLDFGRATPVFAEIIRRYIGSPINFSFLHYWSLETLLRMVATCQVDFGVIGTLSPFLKNVQSQLANDAIEYHMLADVPVCALAGPQSPLYDGPDQLPLEALYPYTIVQHGSAADDPTRSIPHVVGLSSHAFGEVHVNSSNLFYQTIQNTPAIGLVAYTPATFMSHGQWSDIRIIRLTDCDVTAQFGWIKLHRMPLTDLAADLLHSIEKLF